MARLGDTQLGNGNFVKPDDLFNQQAVFTLVNAIFREKGGFEGKNDSIRYTIILNGEEEEKDFDLTANESRMEYVKYFQAGGEQIENLQFKKVKTNKGNPAWAFEDAGE